MCKTKHRSARLASHSDSGARLQNNMAVLLRSELRRRFYATHEQALRSPVSVLEHLCKRQQPLVQHGLSMAFSLKARLMRARWRAPFCGREQTAWPPARVAARDEQARTRPADSRSSAEKETLAVRRNVCHRRNWVSIYGRNCASSQSRCRFGSTWNFVAYLRCSCRRVPDHSLPELWTAPCAVCDVA